jgi:hypothetical protein
MTIRSDMRWAAGGSVKRSLAMALLGCDATIAKARGLDAATRANRRSFRCAPGSCCDDDQA